MNEAAQKYFDLVEVQEASTVLVSGANSAVGSFLIEELLKLKCKVIGIDEPPRVETRNLSVSLAQPNFSYLKYNLSQESLKF